MYLFGLKLRDVHRFHTDTPTLRRHLHFLMNDENIMDSTYATWYRPFTPLSTHKTSSSPSNNTPPLIDRDDRPIDTQLRSEARNKITSAHNRGSAAPSFVKTLTWTSNTGPCTESAASNPPPKKREKTYFIFNIAPISHFEKSAPLAMFVFTASGESISHHSTTRLSAHPQDKRHYTSLHHPYTTTLCFS